MDPLWTAQIFSTLLEDFGIVSQLPEATLQKMMRVSQLGNGKARALGSCGPQKIAASKLPMAVKVSR